MERRIRHIKSRIVEPKPTAEETATEEKAVTEPVPQVDTGDTSAADGSTAPDHSETDVADAVHEKDPYNEMKELMKLADIKEREGNIELAAQLRREACIRYRLWHGINNRGEDPTCELAHCYDNVGNEAKAKEMQRNIVRLYASRYGEVHANTVLAKTELALMVYDHNDKRESEALFDELLDKTHRFFGTYDYVRAKVIKEYLWFFRHDIDEKTLYALEEEYYKALPHLPEHLAELEDLFDCAPESRNERVWAGYWRLASFYEDNSKYAEMAGMLDGITITPADEKSFMYVMALNYVMQGHAEFGNCDKVIEICNTAIRILEKGGFDMEVSEDDRLELLESFRRWLKTYEEIKSERSNEVMDAECVAQDDDILDAEYEPATETEVDEESEKIKNYMAFAEQKERAGELQSAAFMRQQACLAYRHKYGIQNPGDSPMNDLAFCYEHVGNYGKALEMQRNLMQSYERQRSAEDAYTLLVRIGYAYMLGAHGNEADKCEARAILDQVLVIAYRKFGKCHFITAKALKKLLCIGVDKGIENDLKEQYYRILPHIPEHLAELEYPGEPVPQKRLERIWTGYYLLAEFYNSVGRYEDCIQLFDSMKITESDEDCIMHAMFLCMVMQAYGESGRIDRMVDVARSGVWVLKNSKSDEIDDVDKQEMIDTFEGVIGEFAQAAAEQKRKLEREASEKATAERAAAERAAAAQRVAAAERAAQQKAAAQTDDDILDAVVTEDCYTATTQYNAPVGKIDDDFREQCCEESTRLMKSAEAEESRGNIQMAEQLRREACIKYRLGYGICNYGEDPIDELALCYEIIGKHEKAQQLQRDVLSRYTTRYGKMHMNTILAKNELARMLFRVNDMRESTEMYNELLEAMRSFPEHHYVRAKICSDYLPFYRGRVSEKTIYALEEEYYKALPHLPEHIEELEVFCEEFIPDTMCERKWRGYTLLAQFYQDNHQYVPCSQILDHMDITPEDKQCISFYMTLHFVILGCDGIGQNQKIANLAKFGLDSLKQNTTLGFVKRRAFIAEFKSIIKILKKEGLA